MYGTYKYLLSPYSGPNTVLDARGITASQTSTAFFPFLRHGRPPTLTTPHEKEFKRMQKVLFPFFRKAYIRKNADISGVQLNEFSHTGQTCGTSTQNKK